MNSTISLDPRIFDSGSSRSPPVAPPRKRRSTLKKGSTLPTSFESDGTVRNGFKDVFAIGGASRVLKYDEIEYNDRAEDAKQTRVSSDDENSLERRLKFGNKKSDKLLGESLSDHLSAEPVDDVEVRKKDVIVTHKEVDEADRSTSSDKKLFFLLNMLEHEMAEEHKYVGKEPVEEPLFVAKKKEIKKHICDDDDHMHHQHFHSHEAHERDSSEIVAPPKPDRDFSKYQASEMSESPDVDHKKSLVEIETEKILEVAAEKIKSMKVESVESIKVDDGTQTKLRLKKSISREGLPTPPEAPKRRSGVTSNPSTPTITVETIEFVNSIDDDEVKVVRENKRPPSLNLSKVADYDEEKIEDGDQTPTTPIISHEFADQMLSKAYGFHGYHPEDHSHNHDDGSNLVTPTSKLTTRKISTARKISTESSPSIDGAESLGGKSTESQPPGSPSSPMKRDYQKLLTATSVNDIIEEIYSKNSEIMQEFQSYLEQSIDSKPVINVEKEKEYLKAKAMGSNECIQTPEPEKQRENEDEVEDSQTFSDSFESTESEQETVTDIEKIRKKLGPRNAGRRRESIEDVDGWFNKHLDLEQKKSELCGPMESSQQQAPGTYDMQATFPFGKTIKGRRDSTSDEFFSDPPVSILRPQVSVVQESSSETDDEKDEKISAKEKSQSPDHSKLLKFLTKE